jgi:hypothetical protein
VTQVAGSEYDQFLIAVRMDRQLVPMPSPSDGRKAMDRVQMLDFEIASRHRTPPSGPFLILPASQRPGQTGHANDATDESACKVRIPVGRE